MGLIVVVVLCLFSFMVFTAAKAYGQPQPVKELRQWPPPIDKCDLPTWERIRKMCPKDAR